MGVCCVVLCVMHLYHAVHKPLWGCLCGELRCVDAVLTVTCMRKLVWHRVQLVRWAALP